MDTKMMMKEMMMKKEQMKKKPSKKAVKTANRGEALMHKVKKGC